MLQVIQHSQLLEHSTICLECASILAIAISHCRPNQTGRYKRRVAEKAATLPNDKDAKTTLDQLQQISSMTTIVSVQNRFNMGTRGSEAIVDYCAANGLAFIPWAPIHDFADTPAVREIAERHGATSRQLVLAWLLARSPAMLPIPGTGSLAHLDENLRAASIALTEEEVSALTRAAS